MRGLFITFEGLDGSGKTTQIKKLADYLKNKNIKFVITQEPGGTKISDKLREILMDPENKGMSRYTELFLYLASRDQHVNELIKPALDKGETVICDRFTDSTVAYQCFARGISLSMIESLNSLVTHKIKPDLTFILSVPVELGITRARKTHKKFSSGKGDRLEQEKLDFYYKVWKGYEKIASKNPKRVRIIDGFRNKDEVFLDIKKEVEKKLER